MSQKLRKLLPKMKQIETIIQEIQLNFLESWGLAWWIQITTKNPACIYYFGPFVSHYEARSQLDEYLEDLIQEGAMGISVEIKRCRPESLTIFEDK
ncbi:MAG: hypothetical protein Kow0049_26030 [Stanieria sp.]